VNKKKLIIITSALLALGVAIYFCIKLWEANTSNYYVPGSVTVTFKPEYRQDRKTVDAAVKSIDGAADCDWTLLQDTGWCELHVQIGKEEEAVDKLSVRPEIEHAYRSLYARAE
jgi:tartrate dehydratase alpha subunit/fumarate hydratase class I-like protein